jgi:hypothetical protein
MGKSVTEAQYMGIPFFLGLSYTSHVIHHQTNREIKQYLTRVSFRFWDGVSSVLISCGLVRGDWS